MITKATDTLKLIKPNQATIVIDNVVACSTGRPDEVGVRLNGIPLVLSCDLADELASYLVRVSKATRRKAK